MKILVDMNLSPEWVEVFTRHGLSAVHWSAVGDPRAEDPTLMQWARETWCATPGRVLFGNYTGQVSLRGMIELAAPQAESLVKKPAADATPASVGQLADANAR